MPTATKQQPGRFTRANYERLIEAFRLSPGNYAEAARIAGIDARSAKRAWVTGWSRYAWAKPISIVLDEEAAKNREIIAKRLADERASSDAQRERARLATLDIVEAEEKLLELARNNIRAIYAVAASLAPAMSAMANKVRAEVLDDLGKPKPAAQIGLDAKTCMSFLARHSLMLQRINGVTDRVIQIGQTRRGEPTSIMGLTQVKDMTPEQAADEIAEQDVILEIIREEALNKRALLAEQNRGEPESVDFEPEDEDAQGE